MKTEKKFTPKERMDAEARIAALRAEANALSRMLKKDDEIEKVDEATVENVTVVETTVEANAEEVTTEETTVEANAEEVTTEETTVEANAEEVTTEETTVEANAEEVTTEETTVEANVEEVTTEETTVEANAEEVTTEETTVEANAEEVTTEETAVEANVEEVTFEDASDADNDNEVDTENNKTGVGAGLINTLKRIGVVVGIALLVAILILLISMHNGNKDQGIVGDLDNGTTDVAPGTPEGNIPVAEFDMDAFKASVKAIAATYTNEDLSAEIDILVENNLGKEQLVNLIGSLGEMELKQGIAQYVVFAGEAKRDQYISVNGLDYNPDYNLDYSLKKAELDNAYKAAVGSDLNPDGVLMSLPGYDACMGNRNAMRALIEESGDTALLNWYNAKMEIYDLKLKQKEDYNSVVANQETVLNNLLKNEGAVELIKLQVQKVKAGELVVIDNATNQYTEAYYNFILDNYIYVVAN